MTKNIQVIGIIVLCALVFTIIIGALIYSIYAIFTVGARSEPKQDYYLVIHKEKRKRKGATYSDPSKSSTISRK